MKIHCDNKIHEIIHDSYVEENLNVIHDDDDRMARGQYGKFEKKVGEVAPPSIYELVNIVKFLQYLKKVPESSTFVIISAKEKIFIATVR